MVQALDPSAYVFEGIWTNWSKGAVRGLTLTLTPAHATIFTNALTLFVTLAGGQLWTIIRFILHRQRSSQRNSNEFHKQQQIILRNTTTDFGTAQFMWSLAWAHRKRPTRSLSFPGLVIILAVAHAMLFMLAGTFSNILAGAGPSVLSRSPHCGEFNQTYYNLVNTTSLYPNKQAFALNTQFWYKTINDMQLSLEYAQKCYMDPASYSGSATCQALPRPTLPFNHTVNAELCPFDHELCHNQAESLMFDTGFIDSHHDLGLNAPHDSRLLYRRVNTCTVLNDTGRIKGWNDTKTDENSMSTRDIAYAYYGPSSLQFTNFTYSYSNSAAYSTNFSTINTRPYQVNAQYSYAGLSDALGDYSFVPIPELHQESADVLLLFLSYVGNYLDAVDDPWFSSHQLHHENTRAPFARWQYARDSAISTVGCTEQHQFCTSNETCTPLLGINQVEAYDAFTRSLTPLQQVTFNRLFLSTSYASLIQFALLAEVDMPILASESVLAASHFLSSGLPDNQWQIELNYWYSISMALLQRIVLEWGTGQISPDIKFLVPPSTKADRFFCQNIMIPSTVEQSFSVLAIVLVLFFGLAVIFVSVTVEQLASLVYGRSMKALARRESWDKDDLLELRRNVREDPWKPQPPPKDYEITTTIAHQLSCIRLGVAPPPYKLRRIQSEEESTSMQPSCAAVPSENEKPPQVACSQLLAQDGDYYAQPQQIVESVESIESFRRKSPTTKPEIGSGRNPHDVLMGRSQIQATTTEQGSWI